MTTTARNFNRKPDWLKIKLSGGKEYSEVKQIVEENKLHTICRSGNCPNIGECWGTGTATFMILGDICTRSCGFCATKTGKPLPADDSEPLRVADSVKKMGLRHAVITSVDRDDMIDGGAAIWANVIQKVREVNPDTTIEVLLPDFRGQKADLNLVLSQKPDIAAHNLETVRRLTPAVRSAANYDCSIDVIRGISQSGTITKSGIMVGLGETFEEILSTMDDLVDAGCGVFTIGQYLQPSRRHLPVAEYIHPDIFARLKQEGLRRGFKIVESNPLVRSSYRTQEIIHNNIDRDESK